MKFLISLITLVLTLTACSSLNPKIEELQASPTCQVWADNMVGLRNTAIFEGDKARQKMTCWLYNMYLCSYNDYSVKEDGVTINSTSLGDVGSLKGNVLKFKMTGSESDPIEIKGGKISYQMTILTGQKVTRKVEYNQQCSNKQVALGLLSLAAVN